MPRRKTTKSGKVYTKTTPRKPLTEAQKAALKKGTAAAKAKADAERAERERIAEEERLAEEKRIAELEAEERIKFRPNEGPQTEFLTAPEQEVLYGGAAGGGKTFALLLDVLQGIVYSDYSALILRRTTDELREIIQVSKEIYPVIDPSAKWHERKSQWTFGSGARIWMTYLDNDDDVHRYQGQAFSYIAFDELTHWPTPHPWDYLRSRLRTTNPNITPYMRATSNPGGPGHCVPFGEVLTVDGWKDIKDVTVGTKVLSVDKKGRQIVKTVTDTVKEYYSGTMVYRKDQMVFTENHRLPFLNNTGNLEVRSFLDLPGTCNVFRAGSPLEDSGALEDFTVPTYKTRKLRLPQPDTISYLDYAELMGWFLSEGHTLDRDKEFGISQIKEPQRTQIKSLLERCKFRFRESSTGFQVSSPKWWNYLKEFGKSRDKYIPRELLSAGYEPLKVLFQALIDGDGHWASNSSGSYYTTSKRLAEDVSEVAVRLGYSVRVSSRQRVNRNGLSYEVNFNSRTTTELNTGNHLYEVSTNNNRVNCSKSQFEGYVYCLTVPDTETFFIRQNGYVWVSGNTWVKKMFVDPAEPGQPFWARDIETGEILREPSLLGGKANPRAGKPLFQRRFIPARLLDNPYLSSTNYMQSLMSLPEEKRRALLEGDWTVSEGAAFPEFKYATHTCDPFDIDDGFKVFKACDYGYGSYSAVLWFAVAPSGQVFIVDELYVSKVLARDLKGMIKERDRKWRSSYGVLDSSCWHKRGDAGPSIAEQLGWGWRPSDRSRGSRVAGKNMVHSYLAYDDFLDEPNLMIFRNCTNLIACMGTVPLDSKNPEDVDTDYTDDHLYDALRYGLMSRPKSRNLMDFSSNGSFFSKPKPVSTFGHGY